MPERIRARGIVVALLVLLTVAGIRAFGPPGDWGRHANHALVVGFLLDVTLAGLLLAVRWRRRPDGAFAIRFNRLVSSSLVITLICVTIAIVINQINAKPSPVPPHVSPRFGHPVRPLPNREIHVYDPKFFSGTLLRDLVVALLLIALAVVLVNAWRRRRRPVHLGMPATIVDEATEDDLARAVTSGRLALAEIDDARAAIIACYLAMERSLGYAGTARGASETPDELLVRAVDAGLVARPPAGLLTVLFYEARFSTHPMPISQRDQAESALGDIAADLPAGDLR